MKQDLYSNGWISTENQSGEIYPLACRDEVFFIISLRTLFEILNLVKSFDKTNLTAFAFSLWENTKGT